jgi:hypothetical protein
MLPAFLQLPGNVMCWYPDEQSWNFAGKRGRKVIRQGIEKDLIDAKLGIFLPGQPNRPLAVHRSPDGNQSRNGYIPLADDNPFALLDTFKALGEMRLDFVDGYACHASKIVREHDQVKLPPDKEGSSLCVIPR